MEVTKSLSLYCYVDGRELIVVVVEKCIDILY